MKNLIWYFLNTHRGIIIKSPVLITNVRDYKLPTKNMEKRKSFLQKKKNFNVEKKDKSFKMNKNKSKDFSQTTLHLNGEIIHRVHFKPKFEQLLIQLPIHNIIFFHDMNRNYLELIYLLL